MSVTEPSFGRIVEDGLGSGSPWSLSMLPGI
jgi:hypothetical protein